MNFQYSLLLLLLLLIFPEKSFIHYLPHLGHIGTLLNNDGKIWLIRTIKQREKKWALVSPNSSACGDRTPSNFPNFACKLKGYFHPTPKSFDIFHHAPTLFDIFYRALNSVNLTVIFNGAIWKLMKYLKYPLSWIRKELNEIKY